MKIPTTLLKSIALGVALGATATACTDSEDLHEFRKETKDPSALAEPDVIYEAEADVLRTFVPTNCDNGGHYCGPCGLG